MNKKVKLILILAIILFSVSSCNDFINFTNTYEVGGSVVYENGIGIKNVSITANTVNKTVSTGENGDWNLSGISGDSKIYVAKEGYDFEPRVHEVNNREFGIIFVGKELKRYDISGVITDNQGEGISGVEISLAGDESYNNVTTNIDGEFSKNGLKGEVVLTPDKEGYDFLPASDTVTEAREDISFIAIKDNYSLSGQIIDEDGKPINNVRLEFESDNFEYGAVYTDEDGEFERDDLRGIVEIIPERPGYDFNPESRSVSVNNSNVDFKGYLREGDYEIYEASGEIKTNDSEGVPHMRIDFYHNYDPVTGTGDLLGTSISESDGEAAGWSKENLWGTVTVVPYGNQNLNIIDDGDIFDPKFIKITDEESGVDFLLER